MKFKSISIEGAYILSMDEKSDKRGNFSRMFCKLEFADYNLDSDVVQINNTYSKIKGTLRGLHYQLNPKAETKIIRCIKGSCWDVILDLRKNSKTFCKWYGTTLTSENRKMMYAPKGCAHGFVTLTDDTEVFYMTTEFYSPELTRHIAWDDPYFGIKWPLNPDVISDEIVKQKRFTPDKYFLGE